jgi:hypothetical protein
MDTSSKRVRITAVHRKDAYYPSAGILIGQTGKFWKEREIIPGWFAGEWAGDQLIDDSRFAVFYAIQYEEIG